MNAKSKQRKVEAITVKLPVLPHEGIGGLHQELCSAAFADGAKAEVSGGFGLGNSMLYVSIDGKRVLAVDGAPMLRALIDAAVDRTRRPRR